MHVSIAAVVGAAQRCHGTAVPLMALQLAAWTVSRSAAVEFGSCLCQLRVLTSNMKRHYTISAQVLALQSRM